MDSREYNFHLDGIFLCFFYFFIMNTLSLSLCKESAVVNKKEKSKKKKRTTGEGVSRL